MATVLTANGHLSKKLPTMLKGELFINENETSGFRDLHFCYQSATKDSEGSTSAKTVILGSEQELKYRGICSAIPTAKAELFGVWQYINNEIKVIPKTENHPKIISGDFIVCTNIDSTGNATWVKLSGSGGEAQDITLKPTENSRLNKADFNNDGEINIQEALEFLSANSLETLSYQATKGEAHAKVDSFIEQVGFATAWGGSTLVTVKNHDLTINGIIYPVNSIFYVAREISETANADGTSDFTLGNYIIQKVYEPKADHEVCLIEVERGNTGATELYAEKDAAIKYTKDHIDNLYKTKADLGKDGKLLVSQLPNTVLGGMVFNGILAIDEAKKTSDMTVQQYLQSLLPKFNKYGETTDDGDYWMVSITNEVIENPSDDDAETISDENNKALVVTCSDGKIVLHSGDYLVYQVVSKETEDGTNREITVGVIDNSDSFRALKVNGVVIDGTVGFKTSDSTKLEITADTDTNDITFKIAEDILHTVFEANYIPIFQEVDGVPKIVKSHISEDGDNGWIFETVGAKGESYKTTVKFAEANQTVTFPSFEDENGGQVQSLHVAYQEWVSQAMVHLDSLTNKHIPFYSEDLKDTASKGLKDSPIVVDDFDGNTKTIRIPASTYFGAFASSLEAKTSLSGLTAEELEDIKNYYKAGAEGAFIKFLTKPDQLITFELDATEVADTHKKVKIYHEDSIIDCGYWE